MSKVERFFHIRIGNAPKGGATIKVTGDTDHPGQVDVQWTKCSKKDLFVKKVGREEATKAPIKVVLLRFLPQELKHITESVTKQYWCDYTYAIRYFLPKE